MGKKLELYVDRNGVQTYAVLSHCRKVRYGEIKITYDSAIAIFTAKPSRKHARKRAFDSLREAENYLVSFYLWKIDHPDEPFAWKPYTRVRL